MATTMDTTALAYQFKRVYGDTIAELFARHTMTYNQFAKSSRKAQYRPGGAGYYFSVRQADPQAVGGRAENAYLPEPLPSEGTQGHISPKLIYAVIRMSGLAIEAGKGNLAAFVEAQGDATMGAYKALVDDLNRMCHGDGYGLLATLSSSSDTLSTSTTWTITCDNDVGVRYLRRGMIVDFYDGTAIDQSSVASRIASIDPINKTAEMEAVAATGAGGSAYQAYHPITAARTYTIAAAAVPDGAYVVRYGARLATHATTNAFYELMGLLGMYDDGTRLASFEGITISSNPEFKANIISNSGVNRELSIDLMLASMDMSVARSGERPTLIRMGLGQRRKYFGLLAPDIRYSPGELKGGYETLKFSQDAGVSIIVDPMTQPNKLFFEPEGAIKRYELTPIGWGGFDPNKMHWRENYDQATMFLRTYTNLGVEKRNALTLLDDLVEPSHMPF